jgi:hypothetical protein
MRPCDDIFFIDHAILPDKMTFQCARQTLPNLAYESAWQASMLRKNTLSTKSTEANSTNWVLRYSSIAFTLLVLLQSFGLMVGTPRFQDLLEGFGGSVEATTAFALEHYWTGCLANIAISVAGSAYLWLMPTAAQSRLKAAYGVSLLGLVGAFSWSAFVIVAIYLPIFKLGTPIT